MNSQIERVESPTREDFEKNYLKQNKPVIITGVASKWQAFSEWKNPDHLKSLAGDANVTVHFNENANFHEWYLNPQERIDQQMKLSELIDKLLGDPPDPRYYMTEHNFSMISNKLLKHVDFSKYLGDGKPFEPLLFLGRDTCMPMHYHGTTEAFLCQLYGKKKITLYSPDQHSFLYAQPWYQRSPLFSQINGRQIHDAKPDYDSFPKFKRARPVEFTLEPGEMLFIPVHWWHLTSVTGYQISVTHFWKAKLQAWHFPTPGLQVIAREVFFQTKKGMGKIAARLKSTAPSLN